METVNRQTQRNPFGFQGLIRTEQNENQDLLECGWSDAGTIASFGIELSQQTIAVFFGALWSGTIKTCKRDLTAETLFPGCPAGQFRASVMGHGFHVLRGETLRVVRQTRSQRRPRFESGLFMAREDRAVLSAGVAKHALLLSRPLTTGLASP